MDERHGGVPKYDHRWNIFTSASSRARSYLANAVETLALAELVFNLPRTLFGLFKAAHGIGLLLVAEVDVAQVKVCTIEILQQLTLPLPDKNAETTVSNNRKPLTDKVHLLYVSLGMPLPEIRH